MCVLLQPVSFLETPVHTCELPCTVLRHKPRDGAQVASIEAGLPALEEMHMAGNGLACFSAADEPVVGFKKLQVHVSFS